MEVINNFEAIVFFVAFVASMIALPIGIIMVLVKDAMYEWNKRRESER